MKQTDEQIFLSYAREDFEIAQRLYTDFKERGLNVWWDHESLLPGENWKDVISKEIKRSKYFLALLSTKSLNKHGYVQKELRIAYEILQESPTNRVYVIPIRVEECEPFDEWLLRINWVDLFASYETGLSKILRVVTPNESINLSVSYIRKKLTANRVQISEELLMKIDLLSDGNPVLVDLALNNLMGDVHVSESLRRYSLEALTRMPKEVLSYVKGKYYAELIQPFGLYRSLLDVLLMMMSLIPSLFTVPLCSHLIDISLSQAQESLDSLAQGPLIEHDKDSDVYTLNDVVQGLLYNHFWSDESYRERKRVIVIKAIDFYESLLADLSIKMDQYKEELERTRREQNYDQEATVIRLLELISKKSELFDEQLKYCQNILN